MLQDYFDQIARLKVETKNKAVLLVGNTTKPFAGSFYTTPIRVSRDHVIGGVICNDYEFLREWTDRISNEFTALFVDVEVKHIEPGVAHPWRQMEQMFPNVWRLPYKSNDLTSHAFQDYFNHLFFDSRRALIIGAGNIGSKVAQFLVESGVDTTVFRRDSTKCRQIADGINASLPSGVIARAHWLADLNQAAGKYDLIVLATPGAPIFGDALFERLGNPKYILDIGKGCLEAAFVERQDRPPLFRLDVSLQLSKIVNAMDDNLAYFGRRWTAIEKAGLTIVPAGLAARAGEVIVDRVDNTGMVFGVANGKGELLRDISPEMATQLKTLLQRTE
jgi:hypothetical protein